MPVFKFNFKTVEFSGKRKNLFILIATFFVFASIPLTVLLTQKIRDLRSHASVPSQQDLDVTYIERTPRYQRYNVQYPNGYPTLASGTENLQRTPNIGESVTFTAHFKNAGSVDSNSFTFKWLVDGIQVSSGSHASLSVGQSDSASFQWAWQSGDHDVTFAITPSTGSNEITSVNNQRLEPINASYLRMQVEQSIYNNFNGLLNMIGSYSFEDWLQNQMDTLNQKLVASGSKERVRIDQITVQADNTLPTGGTHADINWNWDGSWGFTVTEWCMPVNCSSLPGNKNDIIYWVSRIQPSLVHEWSHQLGMAHSYDANVDIATNNTITGQRLVQSDSNIVGTGGDDVGNAFSFNTLLTSYFVLALDSNHSFRRGYYADYLFNVPNNNILQIKNAVGDPLPNAPIKIWQSQNHAMTGNPIFNGTSDANGQFVLPNQALPLGNLTTATGHMLKPNPFGVIDVNGNNGLLLIEISLGSQKDYKFLTVHNFNLAYYKGNPQTATYPISTSLIANANPNNIALNKAATAYCNSSCAAPASAGVDGDKTTINSGYWSPTGGSGKQGDWWKLDLGAAHNVYKIIVFAGAQNNHDWYSKFHLETSTTGSFSGEQTTVATEENWDLSRQSKQSVTYTFRNIQSRYVRLVSDVTQNFIRMQELEVYEIGSKLGDINGDNLVNSADLAVLLSTWGSSTDLRADINTDGHVNSADLAVLLSQWGN